MPLRALLLLVLFTGQAQAWPAWALPEWVRNLFGPASPHERYTRTLERKGLDGTLSGRAWLAAAQGALERPLPVEAGFRERLRLDGKRPRAVGYAFEGRLGEALDVDLEAFPAESLQIFLDLFPEEGGGTATSRPGALARETQAGRLRVRFAFPRDGSYRLRLQPRLGQSGTLTVRLQRVPTLGFPVAGCDARAVVSVFGDPRDGGRRTHHGVDILAPRGTPVVAPADGRAWTGENRLGGKVVWVRAGFTGPSYYFAHLDAWAVSSGRRVRRGDTLGFVGNTGNARHTPPHLHFGIYGYGSGAVDPLPFLRVRPEPEAPAPAWAGDLGVPARVRGTAQPLRAGPSARSRGLALLDAGSRFLVLGAIGSWLRVELADGTVGFLRADRAARAE